MEEINILFCYLNKSLCRLPESKSRMFRSLEDFKLLDCYCLTIIFIGTHAQEVPSEHVEEFI